MAERERGFVLLFCITIEIRWSYVSRVGKAGATGWGGGVDRRGSVQKIRRKSDDGGGNKEGDFGRKQEETKECCISTLPFPLSQSLSAIDPDRPLARRIIIFGAKLNKKKKIQTILTRRGGEGTC